jgi:hypothetical protein
MNQKEDTSSYTKKKRSKTQGKQTLFRVTYRTQINLIRIADNKANMIIGINAMIISVLIGMIGTSMIFSAQDANGNITLVLPIVMIIFTALFTALFAIMAAQPRIISSKKSKKGQDFKSNLLFFENIWDIPTDEYIEKMESLLDSSRDLYQNMIIDIHNQAKILHRKYKLLHTAYVIFEFGYTISILVFLILWLLV